VVQPIREGNIQLLIAQKGCYTVRLHGLEDGQVIRRNDRIRCIQRGINPYLEPESFLREAENPDLRFIVSNTTEAGIEFDARDRLEGFPDVSFPAKLTSFLKRRFDFFNGDPNRGCILLPCELIVRNGCLLKECVLHYAKLWKLPSGFSQWIEQANTFCNTLVDRIVPGFPLNHKEAVWKELGWNDALVVQGEWFHLWIIEAPPHVRNEFPADQAGLNVIFTADLTPYCDRKVRLLNGTHTAMTPLGLLCGFETVQDTLKDPLVGRFLHEMMFGEILLTVKLPDAERESYAQAVMERFQNPTLEHSLRSIALNSISKVRQRLVPILKDYLDSQRTIPRKLTFAIAVWIWTYQSSTLPHFEHQDTDTAALTYIQQLWQCFEAGNMTWMNFSEALVTSNEIWGRNLGALEGFQEAIADSLAAVRARGIRDATIELLHTTTPNALAGDSMLI
jgi:tagaturonate reductase